MVRLHLLPLRLAQLAVIYKFTFKSFKTLASLRFVQPWLWFTSGYILSDLLASSSILASLRAVCSTLRDCMQLGKPVLLWCTSSWIIACFRTFD